MWLVRETGTYYKEFVVDGTKEDALKLKGNLKELPAGLTLLPNTNTTIEIIKEVSLKDPDYAIRTSISCLLDSVEEEVKPKKKRAKLSATEIAKLGGLNVGNC